MLKVGVSGVRSNGAKSKDIADNLRPADIVLVDRFTSVGEYVGVSDSNSGLAPVGFCFTLTLLRGRCSSCSRGDSTSGMGLSTRLLVGVPLADDFLGVLFFDFLLPLLFFFLTLAGWTPN